MSREELAVLRARRTFQTGKTKPLEFRLQQLKNLLRFITERRKDIAAAVKKDLGKVSWQPQEKCGKVLKVIWQKGRQGPIRLCSAWRPARTTAMNICFCLQSEHGTELFETLGVEGEINLAVGKLAEWAAPRPVEKNLLTMSDEVYVQPEPLGVVLIIGAWNYPWAVTLQPLVGAIAAGTKHTLASTHICCWLYW